MQGDISIREDSKKVMLAFVGSLLAHLLLLTGVGIWLRAAVKPESPPPPKPKPMSVVLVRPAPTPPPVVPLVRQAPRKAAVEVPDFPSEKDKPENPITEADRNLKAASELPGSGSVPLPSQEGKAREFVQIQERAYRPGSNTAPQPPAQRSSQSPAETADPRPAKPAPEAAPTPVPRATPKPTPIPKRQEVAMLRPASTPVPTPPRPVPNAEAAHPATPVQQARPNQTQPDSRPSLPSYQSESSKTKISGNISNRGKASVAAEATPLGRYQRLVRDAIGSRWNLYTRSRIDLITLGTARIKFQISESGKVENLKVVENSSNEIFATCTIQAVLEAEIPAIPPEVAASLEDRQLEVEYTFNIYAN